MEAQPRRAPLLQRVSCVLCQRILWSSFLPCSWLLTAHSHHYLLQLVLRDKFGSLTATLLSCLEKTHPSFSVAFDVQLLREGKICTLLFLLSVWVLGSSCSSPAQHSLGPQGIYPGGEAVIPVEGNPGKEGKPFSVAQLHRAELAGEGHCSRQTRSHGTILIPKRAAVIPGDATREAPTAEGGITPGCGELLKCHTLMRVCASQSAAGAGRACRARGLLLQLHLLQGISQSMAVGWCPGIRSRARSCSRPSPGWGVPSSPWGGIKDGFAAQGTLEPHTQEGVVPFSPWNF